MNEHEFKPHVLTSISSGKAFSYSLIIKLRKIIPVLKNLYEKKRIFIKIKKNNVCVVPGTQ